MRLLEDISETEVIALFLRTEIASSRYSQDIVALLERDGQDRSVVDTPDIENKEENRYRLRLIGNFRGYGQNRALFENFPDNVSWHRATLSRDELAQVRYIDFSYWNELSNGSRLPADAVKTIRSGVEIYGVSINGFLRMAEALRQGAVFPELILVGEAPGSPLVVLEGHTRLTAYFLAPERIPQEVRVITGFSPDLKKWLALDGL